MAKTYRIHPAIGIARMGDSENGWFLGPEAPGQAPEAVYKEGGEVKRQGARFRIWEYTDDGGIPRPVREVTAGQAEIAWKVRLGNRKALGINGDIPEERLIIDSGWRQITGRDRPPVELAGAFQGAGPSPVPVRLGHLRTDAEGRLIVLGGFGRAFSPTRRPLPGLWNPDWCDDASDGPVTAWLRFSPDAPWTKVHESAWLIVGPPDFAPPVDSVSSLYDVVYDTSVDFEKGEYDPLLAAGAVSFTHHVYPQLERLVRQWWVYADQGYEPGGPKDYLKPEVFNLLRDNDKNPESASYKQRQKVHGELKALADAAPRADAAPELLETKTRPDLDRQLEASLKGWKGRVMERWAKGDFTADWLQAPPLHLPFVLDKAALDAAQGHSFSPGIEASKNVSEKASYSGPFRIRPDLPPGTLTQLLAVPWQADFYVCGFGYWPAQRPCDVYRGNARKDDNWIDGVAGKAELVESWARLGYVLPSSVPDPAFQEKERGPV